MEKVLKGALYELIKLHLRIHAGWGGGGGIAQRFKGRKIFRKHSSRQKLFHPFVLKILNRICLLVSLFFFFFSNLDRHFRRWRFSIKMCVYRVLIIVFCSILFARLFSARSWKNARRIIRNRRIKNSDTVGLFPVSEHRLDRTLWVLASSKSENPI